MFSRRGIVGVSLLLFGNCESFSLIVPKTAVSTIRTSSSSSIKNKNVLLLFGAKEEVDWFGPALALAVPTWISMMADPVLSMMDTAFVGRVGSIELAALGACTSIFHLAFHAFRATSQATTTLVATAETPDEKRRVILLTLVFGMGLGTLVAVLLKTGATWSLGQMGIATTSALYEPAQKYLQTRAWAGPAVVGLTVAEGAFRGYGDANIPLVASMVAAIINLVLDPLLMFPCRMGVVGAAAATALAQVGALLTYMYFLFKRNMLPNNSNSNNNNNRNNKNDDTSAGSVLRTILSANAAMIAKQGSLLLGWACATARATRLGANHVAAHQVTLSCWLIAALWLDGAASAGQVLLGQHRHRVRSLARYMFGVATVQGVAATACILGGRNLITNVFTSDAAVRQRIAGLVPCLAWQQPLISWTLMAESLSVGGKQFQLLAAGTALSTVLSIWRIGTCQTIEQIWSRGIVSLFLGRLLTGMIGTLLTANVLTKWNL